MSIYQNEESLDYKKYRTLCKLPENTGKKVIKIIDESKLKTCPKCGNQGEGKYCAECGAKLAEKVSGSKVAIRKKKKKEKQEPKPERSKFTWLSEKVHRSILVILFVILLLKDIFYMYENWGYVDVPAVLIMTIIAEILIVLGFAKKNKEKIVMVGLGTVSICVLYNFLRAFAYGAYISPTTYSFSLLCVFPALLRMVAYVTMFLVSVDGVKGKKAGKFKKIWIAPAIEIIGSHLVGALANMYYYYWPYGETYMWIETIITTILVAAAFLFTGMWMVRKVETE